MLLAAIANQTKEFLFHFSDPIKYLLDNDITRGGRDVILIERRGWVAAGNRARSQKYWLMFRTLPYKTLILCLESIIATTKSISTFNRDLESFISNNIHCVLSEKKDLNKFSGKKLKKYLDQVSIIVSTISKARTLSPCEDISSNILPHIKSQTSIEAIKRFKRFALDDLVDLAHSRMENYAHFLKSLFEILTAVYSKKTNTKLRVLTIMLIVIGVITIAFQPIVFERLLELLKRLAYYLA